MLYVLIGYMFLFIHRPFEVWPWLGEYRVERLYVFLAGLVWLIAPRKRLEPTRLDLGIFAFCCAVLFAWGLSPWNTQGQAAVEDWFKIVVFYVLVTTAVTRPEELRKLLLAFGVIMAVYMLHSLWEFKNGRHTYRMGIPRMIGVDKTLGDPNSFGASIVYALPFVRLFWLTSQHRLLKFCMAGYVGLSALCILLTGSRSSLLGLLVWGFITCMQSSRRLTWLVLGSVLACGAFVALPGDLQTRFETMINPDVGPASAKASGQGRLDGLVKGFELLQKYPLSGCGPGVWRKATGSDIESHSLYGQLMGELGLVGLVAFGGLVAMFLMALKRFRRKARTIDGEHGPFFFQLTTALATATFLLLLEGFFGHNLLRFSWLWYIGFLVIAMQAARKLPVMSYAMPRFAMPRLAAYRSAPSPLVGEGRSGA